MKFKVPILSVPDTPLTSTTQDFLPLAEVVDDLVLFKDGGAALVMETSSLNFGLLSEKEQEAVIFSYAALLNSLSFPLQIVIRSQRKDITNYMIYLKNAQKEIANPKLAGLMEGYQKFVSETIKKKNVLGKTFYLVLPFSSLELGIAKSALSLAKNKGPLPYPRSYCLKKAKMTLYPKRDHLFRQAGRLGLKLRQLTTQEITDLYFEIFNSDPPYIKKIEGGAKT